MDIELHGESLRLLPDRALYWPARQALLLADLHLGKSGHFRRHGIPVPGLASSHTLRRLETLVDTLRPEQIVFLGDLFHSSYNAEWEEFARLMRRLHLPALLVRGNHDLLPPEAYAEAALQVVAEGYPMPPFELAHAPTGQPGQGYRLCGHLHPGVQLSGKGRQQLRLPCFHFGAFEGVLPAFGQFTGLAMIEPAKTDQVYVLAEDQVWPIAISETD
ncbi:MAG: ligase-associated DNA damage response endonuclease PdeM [Bacteroidetes bacterium]|nr:MAG: ligase-associated DNA damage response endonuclease PdeM [Bacteroidota bacterium]